MDNISILLVGAGKMGKAMLSGWVEAGYSKSNITVIEPTLYTEVRDGFGGIEVFSSVDGLLEGYVPDIIVFAVKPQVLQDVAGQYKSFKGKGSLFLSIAAGKSIGFFKNILGGDALVVRAMPNISVLTRSGITALCAEDTITTKHKTWCSNLLQAVGKIVWIDDEKNMDAITAVSGSGPAYLFFFMECFVDAAINAGLEKHIAQELVRETIIGSANMVGNYDKELSYLRKQVTSSGGTTEAAIQKMVDGDNFAKIINDAVDAAKNRSIELSE